MTCSPHIFLGSSRRGQFPTFLLLMTLVLLRNFRYVVGSLSVRIGLDNWHSSGGIWMFFSGLDWVLILGRKIAEVK